MITYKTTGKPQEHGVYACRVVGAEAQAETLDEFLHWGKEGWTRRSGEIFRGKVLGYIGPLQRKLPAQFAKF